MSFQDTGNPGQYPQFRFSPLDTPPVCPHPGPIIEACTSSSFRRASNPSSSTPSCKPPPSTPRTALENPASPASISSSSRTTPPDSSFTRSIETPPPPPNISRPRTTSPGRKRWATCSRSPAPAPCSPTSFPPATLFRRPHVPHGSLSVQHLRPARQPHTEPAHHPRHGDWHRLGHPDRKSTRLNSSHRCISYAVFCLKKYIPVLMPHQDVSSTSVPLRYRL